MTTDDMVVDVSQDWVLACDVQQRFMQGLGRTSDSVDYSARCRQVRALGGDCYELMPLTNDRLALVVGDASGKGVAAALMSPVCSPRFEQRRYSWETTSPHYSK